MAPRVRVARKENTSMPEKSMGRIKATSMSKTKKITTIKKNFMQKGNREMLLGSNPHSKGEDFSLSTKVLKVRAVRVMRVRVIARHVRR